MTAVFSSDECAAVTVATPLPPALPLDMEFRIKYFLLIDNSTIIVTLFRNVCTDCCTLLYRGVFKHVECGSNSICIYICSCFIHGLKQAHSRV